MPVTDWVARMNGTLGYSFTGGGACGCSNQQPLGDVNNDGRIDLIRRTLNMTGSPVNIFFTVDSPTTSISFGMHLVSSNLQFTLSETGYRIYKMTVGDINDDGRNDLIFSITNSTTHNNKLYVVFGLDSWGASYDITSLMNGTDGFSIVQDPGITGLGTRDLVSFDANGDGIDDIIVSDGEYVASTNGSLHVIYGHAGPWTDGEVIGTYSNGTDGFRIDGHSSGLRRPENPLSGDINGDGRKDIILLTYDAPWSTSWSGRTVVLFGPGGGAWPHPLSIGSLDGSNGFVLNHTVAPNGRTLAVGDVDNDGNDDILIGMPRASWSGTEKGGAYLVFGKDSGWAASSSSDDYADGVQGVRFIGPSTGTATFTNGEKPGTYGALADITGDGYPDIIINAGFAAPRRGDMYVVYGKANWSNGSGGIDLIELEP